MEWVKQKDKNGCGIACLSMITGIPYDRIRADWKIPNWEKFGITAESIINYLAEKGYWCRDFTRYRGSTGRKRRKWPLAPFADYHIVLIHYGAGNAHFVVMDKDGNIFDPDVKGKFTLDDYTKWEFWRIIGIKGDR